MRVGRVVGTMCVCVCVCDGVTACVDMPLIPSVTALSCPPVCLPVSVSVLSPTWSVCLSFLLSPVLSVFMPLTVLCFSISDITCCTGGITVRKTSTCTRNDDSVDLCIIYTHTHTHIHTHTHSPSCLPCLEVCWEVGMLLGGGGGREKPELRVHLLADPPSHDSL